MHTRQRKQDNGRTTLKHNADTWYGVHGRQSNAVKVLKRPTVISYNYSVDLQMCNFHLSFLDVSCKLTTWNVQLHTRYNTTRYYCQWLVGTSQRVKSLPGSIPVNVAGTVIQPSARVKIIGATLDSNLNMDNHTKSVSKSCFYHIRSLRHIRSSLDDDLSHRP